MIKMFIKNSIAGLNHLAGDSVDFAQMARQVSSVQARERVFVEDSRDFWSDTVKVFKLATGLTASAPRLSARPT